jgi:hypothetical protein
MVTIPNGKIRLLINNFQPLKMKKIVFTIYNEIYHFIKDVIGEQDIPEYSTTIFVSTLQLIFVLITINSVLIIVDCKTITFGITLISMFLILSINMFLFHVQGLKDKVLNEGWDKFTNKYFAKFLTASVPLLLLVYFILSMIFMKNTLEECL